MEIDGKFGRYRGERIALYGLGAGTQEALRELRREHEVVGLLDSFREDGELYGERILSFDAAVGAGIALIVIVARPGSCRAIAKRIGERCRDAGIALMDIRGKDMLAREEVSYCHPGAARDGKEELRERIERADVVSFDLFDTLVMRRTLYPEDVAEHVRCRLEEAGIRIDGFSRRRLASEKELSRDAPPTLAGIYQDMLARLDSGDKAHVTADMLARLEWETDLSLLVPRKEVCRLFREAAAGGKRVYVVTDTYYDSGQVLQIIREKCGLSGCAGILASCVQGTDKARGLFGALREREPGADAGRFLHIGDDAEADVRDAQRWGISACRLPGGAEMMEDVGYLGLAGHLESLSGRLRAGMLAAGLFNSPFCPEDGRIGISDAYDVGYLLCAPMIGDFVLWLQTQVEGARLGNIWFSARDGHLVKELYGCLMGALGQEDRSVYFLTSRTAAVRAGVQDEEDIRYVDGMRFSGTLGQSLEERFGISADDGCGDAGSGEDGLMRYRDLILERARSARNAYRRYIGTLDMGAGDIAFFDLVAKGTAQMFVQRLTGHHLRGFYLLQLEKDQMAGKGLDIQSFYEEIGESPSTVYEDYYILEALLTAPHPSVVGFDQEGRPVCAAETRTEEDIRCIGRVQEGISDHFRTYLELCPASERTIDKGADAVFLDLIHKVAITAPDVLGLVVEDPFFNRNTRITDIL